MKREEKMFISMRIGLLKPLKYKIASDVLELCICGYHVNKEWFDVVEA